MCDVLLAGFEGQGGKKLHRDTADTVGELVNAADGTASDKVAHIETVIRLIIRNTEAGGDVLAWIGAAPVVETGKGRPCAADVDHLTLGEDTVKILGEPDRPVVS